jgi:hypothetical protein
MAGGEARLILFSVLFQHLTLPAVTKPTAVGTKNTTNTKDTTKDHCPYFFRSWIEEQ